MEVGDKVEITNEHLTIMREKYDCKEMTDEQIVEAMLIYEKKYGGKYANVLDILCFPNFQSILHFIKSK